MQRLTFVLLLVCYSTGLHAQLFSKPVVSGLYFQWGYNRDIYSKSDMHFKNGSRYDFMVYDVAAHDRPDFESFLETPLDVTIPQNSYRIGLYLNKGHTHAIELNFDHAKYVMTKEQTLHIDGQINGERIDKDTLIKPNFLYVEHTNGANFYHINYVGQREILHNNKRMLATAIWKGGAGIVIPKSDVTVMGKRLDNKYHVAGYIISAEAGLRFYPLKKLFMEATLKGGYANYLNALALEGGTFKHHFYYGEILGMVGYDLDFKKPRKQVATETTD